MRILRCWIIVVTVIAAACTSKDYNPDTTLTAQEKDAFMTLIARYAVKAPENVLGDERFAAEHDAYYQQRLSTCRLEQYYRDGEKQYFLLSQPAPSLTEKRHATGGVLEAKDGELLRYQEVFRTWKMIPDTLRRRSYLLFDKMVKGESLERFRTKYTVPEEYIEFPDDNTFYDTDERTWKVK